MQEIFGVKRVARGGGAITHLIYTLSYSALPSTLAGSRLRLQAVAAAHVLV